MKKCLNGEKQQQKQMNTLLKWMIDRVPSDRPDKRSKISRWAN
jgi:hypothetical protein